MTVLWAIKFQNWNGRGRPNFWVTPLKFSKSIHLLEMFKWYYYHFLIFLLDSDLPKISVSVPSISWDVLALFYIGVFRTIFRRLISRLLHRGSDPHRKIVNQILKIMFFWPLGVRTNPLTILNWFASVFWWLRSWKKQKDIYFAPENHNFPY